MRVKVRVSVRVNRVERVTVLGSGLELGYRVAGAERVVELEERAVLVEPRRVACEGQSHNAAWERMKARIGASCARVE